MFNVRWEGTSLEELATVWVQADSAARQAITAATHTIDQQLRNNPDKQGESRGDEERVLFVPPLGVTFEVDSAQHIVSIYHIWVFQKRDR
jgi:hypothetical protein